MAKLEIDGKQHDLTRPLTLGRSSACDIILGDADTSRRHAKVWVDDGQGWVEDLGTQNGTKVNDIRITAKCRLVSGDTIRIGQHRLTFIGDAVPLSEAATMLSPQGVPPKPPVIDQTFHPDSAARSSGNMPAPGIPRETPATGNPVHDTWTSPPPVAAGVPAWVVVLVAIASASASGLVVWYL